MDIEPSVGVGLDVGVSIDAELDTEVSADAGAGVWVCSEAGASGFMIFEEINCWSAPASMSLEATAIVVGLVRLFKKRSVAERIPVRSAVATS